MTTPVLNVVNLSVHLGGREILRDLTFDVDSGAALAVIGPNGSGKTVLFRALIGALPYEGHIGWAPGTRVGYVPQKLDLERNLPVTGRDLLEARARLASVPLADARYALSRVRLEEAALDRLIGTFSGGQFQRLLIACALLAAPTVLLLDEATAGIDEPGQERINEILQRIRLEQGVTVILISHDLSVVSRYATHVLCLTREHTCFGVPRHALTSEVLARIYGEPVGVFVHEHVP